MKFKRPSLDLTARRLENAHTIADLRAIAKRVTPTAPFDYTDGAAEAELSLARARQAFQDIPFRADGRESRFVDVIIGEVQPVAAENPEFGVPLPDGKACLPDPLVSEPSE